MKIINYLFRFINFDCIVFYYNYFDYNKTYIYNIIDAQTFVYPTHHVFFHGKNYPPLRSS